MNVNHFVQLTDDHSKIESKRKLQQMTAKLNVPINSLTIRQPRLRQVHVSRLFYRSKVKWRGKRFRNFKSVITLRRDLSTMEERQLMSSYAVKGKAITVTEAPITGQRTRTVRNREKFNSIGSKATDWKTFSDGVTSAPTDFH